MTSTRENPSAKNANTVYDTGEPDEAKVSRPVRREAVGKVSVTGQLAGGPPYFCGVLVELLGVGERYVLLEAAAGSGNRLLEFRTQSPQLARSLFEAELSPTLTHTAELDGEAYNHQSSLCVRAHKEGV